MERNQAEKVRNFGLAFTVLLTSLFSCARAKPTPTPTPTRTPTPVSTSTPRSTLTPTSTPRLTTTPLPTATPSPTSTHTPVPVRTQTPRYTPQPRTQVEAFDKLFKWGDENFWDIQLDSIYGRFNKGDVSIFYFPSGPYNEKIDLRAPYKESYRLDIPRRNHTAIYSFFYTDQLDSSGIENELRGWDYYGSDIRYWWENYKGGLIKFQSEHDQYGNRHEATREWVRFEPNTNRIVKISTSNYPPNIPLEFQDIRNDVNFYVDRGTPTRTVSKQFDFAKKTMGAVPTKFEPSVQYLRITAGSVEIGFKDDFSVQYIKKDEKTGIGELYKQINLGIREGENFYERYTKGDGEKFGDYLCDVLMEDRYTSAVLFIASPDFVGVIRNRWGRTPTTDQIRDKVEPYLSLLSPSVFN